MNDVWSSIGTAVAREFSDISAVGDAVRVFVRLAMATLLGAALGYERERSGKAAGLRTHMLVALGSAMFIVVPWQLDMPAGDVSRVMQGVITGIGFLGAGAIIKFSEAGEVKGLTTSGSIWLTAAIGIAAGAGLEATAVLGTLVALFILAVLPILERKLAPKDKL